MQMSMTCLTCFSSDSAKCFYRDYESTVSLLYSFSPLILSLVPSKPWVPNVNKGVNLFLNRTRDNKKQRVTEWLVVAGILV